MRFTHFTLEDGQIIDRCRLDTQIAAPDRLARCARNLMALSRAPQRGAGSLRLPHGEAGLARFEISRGFPVPTAAVGDLPEGFRAALKERLISFWAPSAPLPFALSLTLPPVSYSPESEENDFAAMATLVTISASLGGRKVERDVCDTMWAHRPFVAVAPLGPAHDVDPRVLIAMTEYSVHLAVCALTRPTPDHPSIRRVA